MQRAASSPLAVPARVRRAGAGQASAAHRAAVADGWRALWTSRLIVWCAGVGAVLAFGLSGREAAFDPFGVTASFGAMGDLLVAPAARWDAVWFLSVAQDGYAQGASEAFFPLYPALVVVAGLLLGSAPAGGVAVSLACLAGALYLLHRLVALDFGREVAATTVLLVALSPAAFFLSAVYSEALFLALSVGAVLAARTDRWWVAGALGARQLLSGAREPVLFTAAGGDPFTVAGHNLHLFAWLVAALVALAGAARRPPTAYTAYAAAALALPLSWPVGPQPLMSLPRFVLVLWPLWLWLALWAHDGSPGRCRVAVAVCATGLVVSTGLFATWHWVA